MCGGAEGYQRLVRLIRAVLETQGYKVTVEQLEAARTEKTKVLLFVSPSNPTGAVYPPEQVEAIGRWAAEKGLWVEPGLYLAVRYLERTPAGHLRAPVFERLTLSDEDRARGRFYAEQRMRADLMEGAGSVEDFYRSLEMRLWLEQAEPGGVSWTTRTSSLIA